MATLPAFLVADAAAASTVQNVLGDEPVLYMEADSVFGVPGSDLTAKFTPIDDSRLFRGRVVVTVKRVVLLTENPSLYAVVIPIASIKTVKDGNKPPAELLGKNAKALFRSATFTELMLSFDISVLDLATAMSLDVPVSAKSRMSVLIAGDPLLPALLTDVIVDRMQTQTQPLEEIASSYASRMQSRLPFDVFGDSSSGTCSRFEAIIVRGSVSMSCWCSFQLMPPVAVRSGLAASAGAAGGSGRDIVLHVASSLNCAFYTSIDLTGVVLASKLAVFGSIPAIDLVGSFATGAESALLLCFVDEQTRDRVFNDHLPAKLAVLDGRHSLQHATRQWCSGQMTTIEYVARVNVAAGRSTQISALPHIYPRVLNDNAANLLKKAAEDAASVQLDRLVGPAAELAARWKEQNLGPLTQIVVQGAHLGFHGPNDVPLSLARDSVPLATAYRAALETDLVRCNLHHWMDDIFGVRNTSHSAVGLVAPKIAGSTSSPGDPVALARLRATIYEMIRKNSSTHLVAGIASVFMQPHPTYVTAVIATQHLQSQSQSQQHELLPASPEEAAGNRPGEDTAEQMKHDAAIAALHQQMASAASRHLEDKEIALAAVSEQLHAEYRHRMTEKEAEIDQLQSQLQALQQMMNERLEKQKSYYEEQLEHIQAEKEAQLAAFNGRQGEEIRALRDAHQTHMAALSNRMRTIGNYKFVEKLEADLARCAKERDTYAKQCDDERIRAAQLHEKLAEAEASLQESARTKRYLRKLEVELVGMQVDLERHETRQFATAADQSSSSSGSSSALGSPSAAASRRKSSTAASGPHTPCHHPFHLRGPTGSGAGSGSKLLSQKISRQNSLQNNLQLLWNATGRPQGAHPDASTTSEGASSSATEAAAAMTANPESADRHVQTEEFLPPSASTETTSLAKIAVLVEEADGGDGYVLVSDPSRGFETVEEQQTMQLVDVTELAPGGAEAVASDPTETGIGVAVAVSVSYHGKGEGEGEGEGEGGQPPLPEIVLDASTQDADHKDHTGGAATASHGGSEGL